MQRGVSEIKVPAEKILALSMVSLVLWKQCRLNCLLWKISRKNLYWSLLSVVILSVVILSSLYYRSLYFWSLACAYWHLWKHQRWHSETVGEVGIFILLW